MKTQGSAVSFEPEWQKFQQTGKWNKYQAVIKAVWADERITAAVSDMDNLDKLRENVAAARDPGKLGGLGPRRELRSLRPGDAIDGLRRLRSPVYSRRSRRLFRWRRLCRYLMYHDSYGKRDEARALYQALPEAARRLEGVDFSASSAACPNGLDVDQHLKRAAQVLA